MKVNILVHNPIQEITPPNSTPVITNLMKLNVKARIKDKNESFEYEILKELLINSKRDL